MIMSNGTTFIPQVGRSSNAAPESHSGRKPDSPTDSEGGKPSTNRKTSSLHYTQKETGRTRAMSLDASLDKIEELAAFGKSGKTGRSPTKEITTEGKSKSVETVRNAEEGAITIDDSSTTTTSGNANSHNSILDSLLKKSGQGTDNSPDRKVGTQDMPHESSPIDDNKNERNKKIFETSIEAITLDHSDKEKAEKMDNLQIDSETSNKRAREDSLTQNASFTHLQKRPRKNVELETIQKLTAHLQELDELVESKYTNTARGIKEKIREANTTIRQLRVQRKNTHEDYETRIAKLERKAINTQESGEALRRSQKENIQLKKSIETQLKEEILKIRTEIAKEKMVEIQNIRDTIMKEKDEEINKLLNQLKEKGSYNDALKYNKEDAWMERNREIMEKPDKTFNEVWQLTEEEWPHKAYAPMTVNRGNPLRHNKESLLIVHWSNDSLQAGLLKELGENSAGGRQMVEREGTDPNLASLETTSNLTIEGEAKNVERQKINSVKMFKEVMTQEEWEKTYLTLQKATRKIMEENGKDLAIVSTNKQYETRIKKMVRCLLVDTELNIEFYASRHRKGSQVAFLEEGDQVFPRLAQRKTTSRQDRPPTPRKKAKRDALIIKTDTRNSYADRLKYIRDIKPQLENQNIVIESIKKTQQGHMIVVMEENSGKLQELEAIVNKNTEGAARASPAMGRKILMMSGMDSLTTAQEVQEAINMTLKVDATKHIEIQPLRETRNGKKTTTLKVTADVADKLLEIKTIKVVYNSCYIRERISIVRCHKCLEFNHREAECTGPDRTDLCDNCGSKDHRGDQCTETPKCFTCRDRNDHKTGTMACPIFRRLVRTGLSDTKHRSQPKKRAEVPSKHESDVRPNTPQGTIC